MYTTRADTMSIRTKIIFFYCVNETWWRVLPFNIFWLMVVKRQSSWCRGRWWNNPLGWECVRFSSAGRGGKYKQTDARERRDFPVMNGRIRRENIYMSDMFPAQWSTYRSARATNKNINDCKMFKMWTRARTFMLVLFMLVLSHSRNAHIWRRCVSFLTPPLTAM